MNDGLKKLQEEGVNWVEANRSKRFSGVTKLLTDLYPDNAHFIYELLQNAEDARDKSRSDSCGASAVCFTLNMDSLEFEHDGEGLFNLTDVESITGIGDSNKAQDPTCIGKFGVGFKAVFAYTNTPEIHSGDFHFRIHDLVVPEPIEPRQMSSQATQFIFPFDHTKKSATQAKTEITDGLQKLGDNTLLFLKHIRKIEYLLPDGALGTLERIEHKDRRIEVRASQPGGDETISNWLLFDKDVEVTDEDGKLKICRIAIAYSIVEEDRKNKQSKWKIVPLGHGQVSIYFPAEKETSNLRFHIHAPFASTVARDSVRDCEANKELRDHLAKLVVESLVTIRDSGMLDVSFLAVLPNPGDNLRSFYEPIRIAIVKTFRELDLTPTRSGKHRPAGALYCGPAEITKVLKDEGLSHLLGGDSQLWAANAPQKNQRDDLFIQSLKIAEWGWEALVDKVDDLSLDEGGGEKFVHEWLSQQEDARIMQFYALLGEAIVVLKKNVDVDFLRIVRVVAADGEQHVAPTMQLYFMPEDDISPPSNVMYVKREVYSAGKSDSEKRFARLFLENIGVRPYDEKAAIEKILKKYGAGHVPSSKDHISHIRQFVRYWLEHPNSIDMFRAKAFLNSQVKRGSKTYYKASDLYLDLPYIATGLEAIFEGELGVHIGNPKQRLSHDYQKIMGFEDFAVKLGVMKQLEICSAPATELQKEFFEKKGNTNSSTIDDDYYINGLEYQRYSDSFLIWGRHKSMALSRAIWSAMCGADPKVLTACYVPNLRNKHKEKSKTSWLVDYLAEQSWVPDTDGNFLRPTEITQKILHPDFKFDDRNGWLTAIRFGEDARKQSEDYRDKDQYAQKHGLGSAEEMEKWKKVRANGGDPDAILAQQAQRQRISQPEDSVQDPDRRQKKVLANTADAPSKESVIQERSIQIGISDVTAQAKAYLRPKYKNADAQLVCQCCHNEMPFKLPQSDEYYFEAVHCIGDKGIRHFQNRLALCPTCAAMYQYARETDDNEIRRSIIEHEAPDTAASVEIPVRLAGRQFQLRFVGTHWFDLKTVLDHSL